MKSKRPIQAKGEIFEQLHTKILLKPKQPVIPKKPKAKPNELFEKKNHISHNPPQRGFSGRQYSLSNLGIKQPLKIKFNQPAHSKEKPKHSMKRKPTNINSIAQEKTEAVYKAAKPVEYQYNFKLNHNEIKQELNHKPNQSHIEISLNDRSPIRSKTPLHQNNKSKSYLKRTPDSHTKRMSLYMTTQNAYSKSPTVNNKAPKTKANHCVIKTKAIPRHYSLISTIQRHDESAAAPQHTSLNAKSPSLNENHVNNRKQSSQLSAIPYQDESAYNKSFIDNDNKLSGCPMSNAIIQKRLSKKEVIRLSKQGVSHQSRRESHRSFILPEEEPKINFNNLDQFSPPFLGHIDLNYKERTISPAASTTYTTIELSNQDKLKGTIASLNETTTKKRINQFIQAINSKPKHYSTIDYTTSITAKPNPF